MKTLEASLFILGYELGLILDLTKPWMINALILRKMLSVLEMIAFMHASELMRECICYRVNMQFYSGYLISSIVKRDGKWPWFVKVLHYDDIDWNNLGMAWGTLNISFTWSYDECPGWRMGLVLLSWMMQSRKGYSYLFCTLTFLNKLRCPPKKVGLDPFSIDHSEACPLWERQCPQDVGYNRDYVMHKYNGMMTSFPRQTTV